MSALLIAVALGYAVAMGALARWASNPTASSEPVAWPDVAVLVAARDEEAALPRCLDALRHQEYPGRLTVYLADDHSTDGTASVVRHYQANGFETLRLVTVPSPGGALHGKANALHAAIQASNEPVLLITDADCAPPPGWARAMVATLATPETGMVCGRTAVAPNGSLSAEIEALDWAYLLTGAGFLAEQGRPVTGMGNNMAVWREAYEAVGGYPALPFSVTEDYALLRAIADTTSWRVRFPNDPALVNQTLPVGSLAAVYRQRARWARGGIRAPRWVYPLYAALLGVPVLLVIGLALAPGFALTALGIKLAADAFLLRCVLGRYRLGALLAWEVFLIGYTLSLPIYLIVRRRLRWKGRTW